MRRGLASHLRTSWREEWISVPLSGKRVLSQYFEGSSNKLVKVMVKYSKILIIGCAKLFTIISAQSTTCLVVSVPASTKTISYTSGETALFPHTTFTAATQTTITYDAEISAGCFTLGVGQTQFTAVSLASASCTTDAYYPATTWFYTVTSGQVDSLVADTTYTTKATLTFTNPAHTYINCAPVFDYANPDTCDTVSSLTWALLALTFIAIQITWWIFEIPILFQSRAQGGGPIAFFDAITWTCVRIHAPASAGFIAASQGADLSEFARIYYLGLRGRAEPPKWTRWKLYKSILVDLFTIVTTIISLYQSATLPALDARRFSLSSWMYPSLPAALIGLSLLLGEWALPRTRRNSVILFGFCTVLVIAVGAAIPLVLKQFGTSTELWYVPLLCYCFMICPFVIISPPALPLAILPAWFARVGGVGLAALSHYAGGQPYCKMPGIGFAVTYMVLGGVAAALGFVGTLRYGKHLWRSKGASP